MIDPKKVCMYFPPNCGASKVDFYKRMVPAVGYSTRSAAELERLPWSILPMVGASLELKDMVKSWRETGRPFIYWDRGYFRRIYEAWLPKGTEGGHYRLHLNCFQMPRIRNVPEDRWARLDTPISEWRRNPDGKIVVAPSLPEHDVFHFTEGWIEKSIEYFKRVLPDREVVNRFRNTDKPLADELSDAMCLVTLGSNAANEAVVMGCPVVVLGDCAARFMGVPIVEDWSRLRYPDRTRWLHSMAYSQFTEAEILDGTAFKLMDDGT